MVEIRRRRVAASEQTVTRRRDRARAVEPDEEAEEEEEAPARRSHRRPEPSRPARRRVVRDEEPEDEEEEEEEEPAPPTRRRRHLKVVRREEDDEEEAEEDDEDDKAVRRARRQISPARQAARTAKRRAESEEDDEDEEPAPRKRAVTRTGKQRRSGVPLGVRVGLAGAEEIRKAGGGGVTRLQLSGEPELVKFLENEPFSSFRQHWIPQGGGQGNRPFTCALRDCPLCEMGDQSVARVAFNVLHLSAKGGPENKVLELGVRAYQALKEQATSKKTGRIDFEKGYWAIRKSGKGTNSQTNFNPVNEAELYEEWEEVFEEFDPDDLGTIIEEAKESVFDASVIAPASIRKLEEQAQYLSEG